MEKHEEFTVDDFCKGLTDIAEKNDGLVETYLLVDTDKQSIIGVGFEGLVVSEKKIVDLLFYTLRERSYREFLSFINSTLKLKQKTIDRILKTEGGEHHFTPSSEDAIDLEKINYEKKRVFSINHMIDSYVHVKTAVGHLGDFGVDASTNLLIEGIHALIDRPIFVSLTGFYPDKLNATHPLQEMGDLPFLIISDGNQFIRYLHHRELVNGVYRNHYFQLQDELMENINAEFLKDLARNGTSVFDYDEVEPELCLFRVNLSELNTGSKDLIVAAGEADGIEHHLLNLSGDEDHYFFNISEVKDEEALMDILDRRELNVDLDYWLNNTKRDVEDVGYSSFYTWLKLRNKNQYDHPTLGACFDEMIHQAITLETMDTTNLIAN